MIGHHISKIRDAIKGIVGGVGIGPNKTIYSTMYKRKGYGNMKKITLTKGF